MRYMILAAAILFMAACKKNKDKPKEYTYSIAPVLVTDGINATSLGHPLNLQVHFQVNNGCGQLDKFIITEKNADTTLVQVRAKYEKGRLCTDNLPVLNTTYTFVPKKMGTHYLKFQGKNDQYLVDTIIVK